MSTMPTVRHKVRLSSENLAGKEGFAAVVSSNAFILGDGATNQATTQQIVPAGVIEAGGTASGDPVSVVAHGRTNGKAGAACAAMVPCVMEYNTGEIIPLASPVNGDYVLGCFPWGAADGDITEFWVDIKRVTYIDT